MVFIGEAVTVQLILESAGPGFTAACTQLGGLHLSARNHSVDKVTANSQPDLRLTGQLSLLLAANLQTA